jgi:hypothetical protein
MVSQNTTRAMFLYQAYGGWHFAKQAELSILSLLAQGIQPQEIAVFTDRPAEFVDLNVHIVPATMATIKSWQRPYCHPHRLKIELIHHVFSGIEAPLIYVDGDTFWQSSPSTVISHIANGASVMHDLEHVLAANFFPKMLAVMEDKTLLCKAGFSVDPTEQISMYNCGLIGLPRRLDPEILRCACRLCDFLSLQVPRKMEWAEQLAFSYLLPRAGPVATCPTEVVHYWRQSFEVIRQIQNYSRDQLSALCQNPAQFQSILARARAVRSNFGNQVLARSKRLQRSWRKRKRELAALAKRYRLAWQGAYV